MQWQQIAAISWSGRNGYEVDKLGTEQRITRLFFYQSSSLSSSSFYHRHRRRHYHGWGWGPVVSMFELLNLTQGGEEEPFPIGWFGWWIWNGFSSCQTCQPLIPDHPDQETWRWKCSRRCVGGPLALPLRYLPLSLSVIRGRGPDFRLFFFLGTMWLNWQSSRPGPSPDGQIL